MVQGEMRQGLGYFHETICPALPVFYRRIDTALKQVTLLRACRPFHTLLVSMAPMGSIQIRILN